MDDSANSPAHSINPAEARRQTFQSARRWTENSLDEEMAKLFRPPDRESLRTMIEMGPEVPKERRRFNETDYKMHRGESFPHMHHPLKALHSSRSSRRRKSTSKHPQSELENEQFDGSTSNANILQQYSFDEEPCDTKQKKVGFYLGDKAQDSTDSMSFDEATKIPTKEKVVEKGAVESSSLVSSLPSTTQENFQFSSLDAKSDAGEELKERDENIEEKEEELRHKHRHKHHHRHKHNRKDDEELLSRQRTGSEVEPNEIRVPFEADEAMLLQEGDLNVMASHRFDDARGMRRHKIQPQPKISSRILLLDLEEKDLPGIAYRIVEAMVANDQIQNDDKAAVMRVLLLRHKHVADHHIGHSFAGLRRNLSSNVSSLTQLNDENKLKINKNLSFTNCNEENMNIVKIPLMSESRKNSHDLTSVKFNEGYSVIDRKDGSLSNGSAFDVESVASNRHVTPDYYIMRKIPYGCEGSAVFVGTVDFLEEPTMAFIRLAEGLYIPSALEVPIPVRFLFILLGPPDCDLDYHEVGRSFSTLMSDKSFTTVAYNANERDDLLRAINEFLDQSIVFPPGDWDFRTFDPTQIIQKKQSRRNLKRWVSDSQVCVAKKSSVDPLKRTGRLFGGLRREVMNRFPLYWSDILDALNPQCLASVVFIYFAALSGAISFGGLLGDKTNNLIGVCETLIATSLSGCIFALFSGQPLMIIGVTGPTLLFDESLYQFCDKLGYEFLTLRVWIGIWVAVFTILFVMFEGSFFLRYITRFTEEILAALISIIFIYESIVKLVQVDLKLTIAFVLWSSFWVHNYKTLSMNVNGIFSVVSMSLQIFQLHPLTPFMCPSMNMNNTAMKTFNETNWGNTTLANFSLQFMIDQDGIQEEINSNEPNTALLSTILMFGTFFIAFFLREFRNGKYLGRVARRALGDFGVPIAIIIMVTLDYLIHETYTQKLQVPSGLTPSKPEERGWFINPMGREGDFPIWLIFGSILPAILFFILIFMEEQIGELLVQKKERNLRKGSGYHIDILLINCLNMLCALIGGPWMSAAIVRAISHIMSLTVMSRSHAPGDKPYILGVKEQRVTNFCVSLLVGVSVAMAPLLRLIPVPVLFGVFLYMGFVSMIGVQFIERLHLLAMPVKHHPDVVYVRRVRTFKMHAFTIIQLCCISLLWFVKESPGAIGLPFVLLLMIPLRRYLFKFGFSENELQALDGVAPEEGNEEEEKDFYQEAKIPG
uniref:Anion exchange protein n=1 Tax=Strigamia maritima TaxID=126957 RepID=T1INN8_STRMM